MGLRSSRVAEAAAAETLDAGASGTGHIEHHQQAVQTVESADDFAKEVQKRVLEARADWEAERVSTTQLHVDDLRALEASHLASIEAKVAQLRSKYDFLRPKPQRSCVDEERQVSECYATAANALDCARFVDQYAACARAVTEQLAISIQAAE